MSYIGITKVGKMFLGNAEIAKAYLGSNLVFQRGGPSPSPTPIFYDRLIFDGVAHVDTTFVLPENHSVRLTVGNETVKLRQGIFQATGGGTLVMLGNNTNSSTRQMVCYYDSSSYLLTKNLSFSTTEYGLFLTPKGYGWNTTYYSFTKGSSHPTGGLRFGYDVTRCFTGRMGTIFIYDSTAQNANTYTSFESYTPVATFRPCTYNGAAGLWYVEGNAFFGNSAGSGTLSTVNL